MYKLLKKFLFCLNPEKAHNLTFSLIKSASSIPGLWPIVKSTYSFNDPKLEKKLFGLTFKNPVGLAAGLDKNAKIYSQLSDLGFGFIEIGTVTPKPQPGNPKPRLFRLINDKAIINRMGFNNLGADEAVEMLKDRRQDIIIGGNIGKNTATSNENALSDYVYCFEKLHDYVDYFVVNVSCPNVKDLQKLQDKDSLVKILETLKSINSGKNKPKPILLKIAPDLNNLQLDEIAEIAIETKISGIVATNTTTKRDGLSLSKDEIEKIGNGGLSGKPLTQRSTEVIRYLCSKTNGTVPIIGVGGIMSAEDALEKINAGASLVQVYTGFIYEGPSLLRKINKAILQSMKNQQ